MAWNPLGWKAAAFSEIEPFLCSVLAHHTLTPHRGKPAADGPRYKALGNSWAVPCAAWIGQRVEAVHQLKQAA